MARLINSLTGDEDLRQDLWVEYLSGACFSTILDRVISSHYHPTPSISQLQSVQHLMRNPPSHAFLNSFNDIEKTIMCLLAIGYNVGDVSVLLGISEVSIESIIVDISLNEVWKPHGTKATFHR
jgi:hypothetical protein